jgi:peptidoglycan glycosyltransferase
MGFSDEDYTRRFPLELPVSVPQLANDVDSIRTNNLLRAHTGYGQGELLTTPLNMAMVVQAVINEGSIPVPYLVESIRDPQNEIIRRTPNRHTTRGIMRARTARQVKEMMVAMVRQYYGENGLVGPGVTTGGKTGTAQLGGDLQPHSWFIGFAEQDGWSVVIAVMLEQGGGARNALDAWQVVAQAAALSLQGSGP